MSLIVELMGGRGVGKSTIISAVKKEVPNTISREGFRKMDDGLNLNICEQFIEHEREYLRREIKDLREFHKHEGVVLLTRGPTDVLMYIDFVLKFLHPEWGDVTKLLQEEIQELNSLRTKNRIYLKASDKVLIGNIKNDQLKDRNNTDFWLKFNSYQMKEIERDEDVFIVDAETNNIEAKIAEVIKYVKGKVLYSAVLARNME